MLSLEGLLWQSAAKARPGAVTRSEGAQIGVLGFEVVLMETGSSLPRRLDVRVQPHSRKDQVQFNFYDEPVFFANHPPFYYLLGLVTY